MCIIYGNLHLYVKRNHVRESMTNVSADVMLAYQLTGVALQAHCVHVAVRVTSGCTGDSKRELVIQIIGHHN